MNDILDLSSLQIASTSVAEFFIGLLLIVLISILLKKIYVAYSSSVSNKTVIANIFPLFSVSIYLIVITIKSSIVLSLGLVGALSIIRFRTAIKEAEQIVYFLILTGISIATAAGSYISSFFVLFFIYIYNIYIDSKKSDNIHSVNDQLVLTLKSITNIQVDRLIKLLNKKNVNVEVQSINKNEEHTIIVLKLSDFNLMKLSLIEEHLKENNIITIETQLFSSTE